jgi:hypothetical protein
MKELKQKEIKRLVKTGAAVDITTWDSEKIKELQNKSIENVGLSFGIYGMNGGLFKDKDGNLYAITARTSNLFALA